VASFGSTSNNKRKEKKKRDTNILNYTTFILEKETKKKGDVVFMAYND